MANFNNIRSLATLKSLVVFSALLILLFGGGMTVSAENHNGENTVYKARVEKILKEEKEVILDQAFTVQELEVLITSGEKSGETIILRNDYTPVRPGARILITDENAGFSESPSFVFVEKNRLLPVVLLVILFIAVAIVVAGWKGARAVFMLAGAMLVILYLLIPGILKGISPLLLSIILGLLILVVAIPFTHGWHRRSFVALLGIGVVLILTAVLAKLAIVMTGLTGLGDEESVFLNFNLSFEIDYIGLLLGGLIIGVLGVLDDIAITQVAVVEELKGITPKLSRKEVYQKAIRVGRDHIASLVNTLVLAYTGVALPLLLLMRASGGNTLANINSEIVVGEIVRMIVSSIGLILTVPVVTYLAILLLSGSKKSENHHHHGHVH